MKGTVDYSIAIKQHQKRLFHSLIIAEWRVESDFVLVARLKGSRIRYLGALFVVGALNRSNIRTLLLNNTIGLRTGEDTRTPGGLITSWPHYWVRS